MGHVLINKLEICLSEKHFEKILLVYVFVIVLVFLANILIFYSDTTKKTMRHDSGWGNNRE